LAETITGYCHNRDLPGVIFNVLKSVKKPKVSFFRRIFQK
jgi:hypothetical protein